MVTFPETASSLHYQPETMEGPYGTHRLVDILPRTASRNACVTVFYVKLSTICAMFESFGVFFSAISSDIINEVQPACEPLGR